MVAFCGLFSNEEEERVEVTDGDAVDLSHVGTAAYHALKKRHGWHHNNQWNVSSGKMVGDLQQTPVNLWNTTMEPTEGQDNWFPQKLYNIMIKTEKWCDLMSLGPPDGVFLEKMKQALQMISYKASKAEEPVIIRMMFGNIVGMPVNCDAIIKELTCDLPEETNIHLWVGAWRKGSSWNHAKLIAVDGKYLHTGGHNLWDPHYLKSNPVHDLSIQLEGRVTVDGHMFANQQWAFIQRKQSTLVGQCAEQVPDAVPLIWKNRVIVSEFPEGKASEFPPAFSSSTIPMYGRLEESVPIISMGRQGALTIRDRPSDDAFVAMIDSAKSVIRMTLQDLGPVCIPNTKMALPGLTWPKNYMDALARVIWLKGVDVEIVLSNPGSIPGGLGPLEACYGNGWSCVDVASEIIKRIIKQFPDAEDSVLRQKVEDNLRVCFIKHAKSSTYPDGTNIGLHSKFFIIDDVCSYTGSQNLYVCDLAEWGVVVDDRSATAKMIDTYWSPMWNASYTASDCDVQDVMDGLDVDRDGEQVSMLSLESQTKYSDAARLSSNCSANSKLYGTEVEAN